MAQAMPPLFYLTVVDEMHSYRLFGLNTLSQIPLPLKEAENLGDVDILIEYKKNNNFTRNSYVGKEKSNFYWEPVGEFAAIRGKKIVVSPKPDISPRLLSLPLLGPVIGALLFQRGFLVLHASAVEKCGKVVAFLGPKGIGKSTTAGKMCEAGWGLITDDVLAVNVTGPPKPLVAPAPPLLKINPDAEHSSLRKNATDKSPSDERYKKSIFLLENKYDCSLPLERIIFLKRGTKSRTEFLGKKDTMINTIKNNYINNISNKLTRYVREKIFSECKSLSVKVESQMSFLEKIHKSEELEEVFRL